MPSENSVYRKIQVVLDVAKSVRVNTLEELRREIRGRKYPNFETLQYDQAQDDSVRRQSDRVIQRTVGICCALSIIGAEGRLTKEGRQALMKARFDNTIASQIRSFLKREGVRLSNLNSIIFEDLQSSPPILPTSRELWTASGSEISCSVFSRMLTLLAQCGGAQSSQKKIYLHVESK